MTLVYAAATADWEEGREGKEGEGGKRGGKRVRVLENCNYFSCLKECLSQAAAINRYNSIVLGYRLQTTMRTCGLAEDFCLKDFKKPHKIFSKKIYKLEKYVLTTKREANVNFIFFILRLEIFRKLPKRANRRNKP